MSSVTVEAWASVSFMNSPGHFYTKASLKNAALEAIIIEQCFSNFNGQNHWCNSFKQLIVEPHSRKSNSLPWGGVQESGLAFAYLQKHALDTI